MAGTEEFMEEIHKYECLYITNIVKITKTSIGR